MPARKDIKKILIIGSGPIIIGQACEFDYSATQACKALMQEGYEVVLVNSNPATIMTDPHIATSTYIEPLTIDYLEKIIEIEKPQAILPTMGGQTSLNLTLELFQSGYLTEKNVEMIGANAEAIEKAENRLKFAESMKKIGLQTARASIVNTLDEALHSLNFIGLPAIIRPAFTLGGEGGGIAKTKEEFLSIISRGLSLSPINQVQIDQSLLGWKEFELEVIRDIDDNCIIVCSIENIDPMGVHTGDSITVAPAQTLTDREYQKMRTSAIAILREIGVETGGSNVQFAVNPSNGEQMVIEMNPRVSRSSALASKATGFPIAKVAALLAVGYRLHELKNDITDGAMPASFEPTIDYVATKIPRFDFEKFKGASDTLTTQMKSVGEILALGRNFCESFGKALMSLENGWSGLEIPEDYLEDMPQAAFEAKLSTAASDRILWVGQAFRIGMDTQRINQITFIDPWFLGHIKHMVSMELELRQYSCESVDPKLIQQAKNSGLSDITISQQLGCSEQAFRNWRFQQNLHPSYRRIDSCAAEFHAPTNYLYSTWDSDYCEAFPSNQSKKVAILGSGPNRIGQGIEFDYCCVHVAQALSEANIESVMINCNPETVSTDFDTPDKLYLEPVTAESVFEIVRKEKIWKVATQFGGQTPLKLVADLEQANIEILGTGPRAIDICEDRNMFRDLCNKLNIRQPENDILPPGFSLEESKKAAVYKASKLNFPLLMRPSFVLGGRAMEIIYSNEDLLEYVEFNYKQLKEYPILMDKFLGHCTEVDVEALADGKHVTVTAILEHIEEAGVHSGDSACSFPAWNISEQIKQELTSFTVKLAVELEIIGLINVQFAINNENEIFILEVNPRASRTVPFVSKCIGRSIPKMAVLCAIGTSLQEQGFTESKLPNFYAIKEAVFPFDRFQGVDPYLGPEMRSTGEVMSMGATAAEAFYKAEVAAKMHMPTDRKEAFISVRESDKAMVGDLAMKLHHLGFELHATTGTADVLTQQGLIVNRVAKLKENFGQNATHLFESGKISLVVNTTEGVESIKDSAYIRQSALRNKIYTTTSIRGAFSLCEALAQMQASNNFSVQSLQLYHQQNK